MRSVQACQAPDTRLAISERHPLETPGERAKGRERGGGEGAKTPFLTQNIVVLLAQLPGRFSKHARKKGKSGNLDSRAAIDTRHRRVHERGRRNHLAGAQARDPYPPLGTPWFCRLFICPAGWAQHTRNPSLFWSPFACAHLLLGAAS